MTTPVRKAHYPVQMQADKQNANDSCAVAMLHVFDIRGEVLVFEMLTKTYPHVIAWDANGDVLREYDNR
jgi:hypothetical protein